MIVVIGGGAAGIAAARSLHDAEVDVLLVEAGRRLGGRAHSIVVPRRGSGSGSDEGDNEAPPLSNHPSATGTRPSPDDMVLDLGCGWLHSARRNPWTGLAERYGFAIDRSSANWDSQWRNLGFPPEDQEAFGEAWDRWERAARDALDSRDRSLAEFLAPYDTWRPMIDAISGYANGAPLSRVSLHDWAAYEDAATDDNWAVAQGYGTLVCRHAAGVAVRLDTIVLRIDHRGRTIRIETNRGTIEADCVILCVPTTVLTRQEIMFDPPLPAKHAAAAALPLGLADKVFLRVEGAELPQGGHLIGDPYGGKTASYRLSPFGWPVIESFFGGDCAEALEQQGDGAAADFAIGELVALLGADWRARLTPLASTRWRREPHIHGSYSHAAIGAHAQRAVLAAPVDARLFFAGEACSDHDFSTAHGAYQTGVAAAEAVLAARRG